MASPNNYGNYGPPPKIGTLENMKQRNLHVLPQPAAQPAAQPAHMSMLNRIRSDPHINKTKVRTGPNGAIRFNRGGRSRRGSTRAKRNRSRRSRSKRNRSRRSRRN